MRSLTHPRKSRGAVDEWGTKILGGSWPVYLPTQAGPKIEAALDDGSYPVGVKVSEEQLAAVHLKRARFHGDWNYALLPVRKGV